MSFHDVIIICFDLPAGKPLHMCIDKAMATIVIGWNGSDHYVPTIHLSAPDVQQWNLNFITIYSQNLLDITSDMEREHLSEVAKNKLDELEVTPKAAVQLFSSTPVAPVACARTATRHKKEGSSHLYNYILSWDYWLWNNFLY